MVRSKRGPALIELMHKADAATAGQPAWHHERGKSAATRTAEPAADGITDQPPGGYAPTRRLVSVSGDRVVLSLSSASAGVAVFLLIVVFGAAFLLGRGIGRETGVRDGFRRGVASVGAGALSAIEAARQSEPAEGIFDDLDTNPVARDARSTTAADPAAANSAITLETPASPWVKDHTYIVVQEFKAGDRSDAAAARLFLAEHGVQSVILDSSGDYPYRLVATKGFNRSDPDQRKWCDAFHAKIRELGRQFVSAGGRYRLQGYQKKVTSDRW